MREINGIADVYDSVYLIAHNPCMSDLCDYLVNYAHPFPTTCVAKLVFDLESWLHLTHNSGVLEWIDYPKK